MRILVSSALICSVIAMVGCEMPGEGGIDIAGDDGEVRTELALGPIKLANSTPLGLSAASSSLYWTSFETDGLGQTYAVVWTGTKDSSPGGEIPLHTRIEPADSSGFSEFASIAQPAGGGPSLYFVDNYSVEGLAGSYIFRMAQDGGGVTLIGASDYVSHRDLVTDGTAVFWSDGRAVYRVPAAGGSLTAVTLQPSPVLAVDSTFVYYVDGLTIRRIRTSGGPQEPVATASSPITALHVDASTHTVFWGEQGGAVRSVPPAGTPLTTYQAPIAGRLVASVGFDGSRLLWIDCLGDRTDCTVKVSQGGVTTVVSAGAAHAGHLQWDATSMFWGQDGGLMKYVH